MFRQELFLRLLRVGSSLIGAIILIMRAALVKAAVEALLTEYFNRMGREVRDSLPTLVKEVKDNGR